VLGYYDNYLVDTTSRVILSVDATPALFSQETLAARRMLEHVGQDISHESIFATSQKRMPTTAPKEKHCAIAVSHAAVGGMSIVRQKLNVSGVHRRSFVPQVPIGNYLYIGRSQRDKQFARWQVRRSTNVPNERVTRWKLCSPNSSNRLSCARYDCDDVRAPGRNGFATV